MASVIQPAISKQLAALQQKLLASGKLQPWTAFQVNFTLQARLTPHRSGIQTNHKICTAKSEDKTADPVSGIRC